MSVELKLDAAVRTDQGKSASRRLRRAKKLPAILYGAKKDAIALALDEEQVMGLMRDETFFSQIIDVNIGDTTERAILKDLQRHPVKPLVVLHMDLQRVTAGQKLRQRVPLHFINEEKAVGVKQGGTLHHDLLDVEIECLPRHLPAYIEVDIATLGLDEAYHLSDLKLPKGVVLTALGDDPDHDTSVVSIYTPRKPTEEEPGEGEQAATVPTIGAEAEPDQEEVDEQSSAKTQG
ncbi:50S ribosomal protein L25/general stress protein Ctc [Nitrococcus mobilis]|uniref:Large ribosomal subunit protein bL25 n=1 Tax=Nitrococcus mobilis Nb-231 TaxID=314278 RepID=A4BMQ9_9GAMM|nr:50S ribosomal protein L25/general stress protein Ctc [Nitrococcus mobilis]EAR23597.1 Ribosomal protein L25 [Nitrococcus mobilis Nb-231]